MLIVAVDPGPEFSALVELDIKTGRVTHSQKSPNVEIATRLAGLPILTSNIAIEMIASYGMSVGQEVFETCVWIGRFMESTAFPDQVKLVNRLEVKMNLCHSALANDAAIRAAIIDRYGGKVKAIGIKSAPGPIHGIKGDCWAALAVALTVYDRPAAIAA